MRANGLRSACLVWALSPTTSLHLKMQLNKYRLGDYNVWGLRRINGTYLICLICIS